MNEVFPFARCPSLLVDRKNCHPEKRRRSAVQDLQVPLGDSKQFVPHFWNDVVKFTSLVKLTEKRPNNEKALPRN
ncbi:hypothetical protein GCM10007931_20560 [Vibrio algivorus]|uniref:Uncharacterized protein n=1 Tax=Vibrio algivorus TaxID=1667024 RepID=A0ABQ6EQ22_9VIBR|nr:hypothetical protein GCM10007931_20560 [Vibrio algivorus]